jgi:hypothetical protein
MGLVGSGLVDSGLVGSGVAADSLGAGGPVGWVIGGEGVGAWSPEELAFGASDTGAEPGMGNSDVGVEGLCVAPESGGAAGCRVAPEDPSAASRDGGVFPPSAPPVNVTSEPGDEMRDSVD